VTTPACPAVLQSPGAPAAPTVSWVYTAWVDIGPRRALGASPLGQRFLVDILGGHFEGPGLCGRVLPGGADRQLLRPDGVRELDALYELQADDGSVLTVRNRTCVDEAVPGDRYARSVVQLTAPAGPHEALNRRVHVGTLHSLRPLRDTVRIDVYRLD
jgi:Protein of unknown function (DUF3237)